MSAAGRSDDDPGQSPAVDQEPDPGQSTPAVAEIAASSVSVLFSLFFVLPFLLTTTEDTSTSGAPLFTHPT